MIKAYVRVKNFCIHVHNLILFFKSFLSDAEAKARTVEKVKYINTEDEVKTKHNREQRRIHPQTQPLDLSSQVKAVLPSRRAGTSSAVGKQLVKDAKQLEGKGKGPEKAQNTEDILSGSSNETCDGSNNAWSSLSDDSITPEIKSAMNDGDAIVLTTVPLASLPTSVESNLAAIGMPAPITPELFKSFGNSLLAQVKETLEKNNKNLLKRLTRLASQQTFALQEAKTSQELEIPELTMDLTVDLPIIEQHEYPLPCDTVEVFENFCIRLREKAFYEYHVRSSTLLFLISHYNELSF